MARLMILLAVSVWVGPALGADDAAKFAGEWFTTRGPMTLEAKGNDLTGQLVFWKLPVKGQVKDGRLLLQYDEGTLHFDANLDVDAAARSFKGQAVVNQGSPGNWEGWRSDPAASEGPPADFSGLWLTNLGLMKLEGKNGKFAGRYTLRGTSAIEGEAKGHHLNARIQANRTGPAWFDMDEAGKNLFGAGGTDNMAPWYAWKGAKATNFANHAELQAGKIVDGSTDGLLTYSVRAPDGYKAGDSKKWPTVLILHGSNMNARAYVNTLATTWPDIARDYILLGINGELPSRIDPANPAFNYTYINYTGRSTYKGYPGTDRESPALVREAMEELQKVYPIRSYFVGGHSQGGYLTYSLLMHSPEIVAGAFPVAGEVIIQDEPTAFNDATLQASQRSVPLAIVHGRTDPMVAFSSATYADGLFLDAGWPAVRLFADDKAGHMFALLPVGPAIRWLEGMTADDPAAVLNFAQAQLKAQAPRDAIAALDRVKEMKLDNASKDRLAKLTQEINDKAGPLAQRYLAEMQANKDSKWVEGFRTFRDEYEFAAPAEPAMKAFNDLRQAQNEPAQKLMNEARGEFNQNNRTGGYAKLEEVVKKYPASNSYRLARTWLADRQ